MAAEGVAGVARAAGAAGVKVSRLFCTIHPRLCELSLLIVNVEVDTVLIHTLFFDTFHLNHFRQEEERRWRRTLPQEGQDRVDVDE